MTEFKPGSIVVVDRDGPFPGVVVRRRTDHDMVERVALAIEQTMFAPHEFPIDPEIHSKYLSTARAAIQAVWDAQAVYYAGLAATERSYSWRTPLNWDAPWWRR